jgi:hypothetical protein
MVCNDDVICTNSLVLKRVREKVFICLVDNGTVEGFERELRYCRNIFGYKYQSAELREALLPTF